jgi:hypothetical protein
LRRILVVVGACAAVIASGAPSAFAADGVITDPNDATGLDVHRVTIATDPLPPVWTITTFRSWTIAKIWDRGYFMVELDTIGGAGAEYRALVRSNGRRMRGSLIRVRRHARDIVVSNLKAHKVDTRSVAVRVPLFKLMFGPDRTSYRWDVLTSFLSGRCSEGVCFDRAPDTGTVDQPLPSS